MRRFFVIGALLFLVPGTAAARPGAPGDGTLSIQNGKGVVSVNARGGMIGHFVDGVLTVKDFNPDDNVTEVVTGAEKTHEVNAYVTKYWGHDIRFRYIGGKFQITVNGSGINLGAIGKGYFSVRGRGTFDDGTFSLNGSAPQPITDVFQIFPLSPTAP